MPIGVERFANFAHILDVLSAVLGNVCNYGIGAAKSGQVGKYFLWAHCQVIQSNMGGDGTHAKLIKQSAYFRCRYASIPCEFDCAIALGSELLEGAEHVGAC